MSLVGEWDIIGTTRGQLSEHRGIARNPLF